jgi:hypothetical protein
MQLPKEDPPPVFQFYTPGKGVEWLPEGSPATTGGARLPVAATHPEEELPEYGLAKGRVQYEAGVSYVYWWHPDRATRRDARDREKFHAVHRMAGRKSLEPHVELPEDEEK